MNPERWRQVKHLFQTAVDLDPTRRRAFLEQACSGDDSLLGEVEGLLASDEHRQTWLSRPAHELAPDLVAKASPDPFISRRLGVHRIVREIGRGGMGTVYLAERADGEYQERVAVKVVKRGMDTEAVLARFRRERQILASLDHPHIARLYDGGATDEGQPYLVMEYIEGTPIDTYCDSRRLDARQRIELFRTVCSAVQTAHRNLVVHRDLKPSNILVTAQGDVKLLDFGVAKLLDPPGSAEALTATADGLQWMTPEYASPEQVFGRPITTASDVYSLGAVLYKLFTGNPPHRFESRGREDIERAIRDCEPERPAAGASHLRGYSGELDKIVLMALRKEAQRRYATVEQLSEDLRRYLAGWPVLAHADTAAYRLSKFLRRNLWGAAAAGLVVASLLGGIIATAWQARLARAQQLRAERVSSFLLDVFRSTDPETARGREVTVREVLERASRDLPSQLQDQPEMKAEYLYTMGVSYHHLGLYEKSDRMLGEAWKIRQDTPGVAGEKKAESLTELGLLRYHQGELDAAEDFLLRALEILRRRLGPKHPANAEVLSHLGKVQRARDDLTAAEDYHRQALGIRLAALPVDHPDIAGSLNNLALVLLDRKEVDEARSLLEDALGIRRRVLQDDHPDLAIGMDNLAAAVLRTGDPERAGELYQQARDIRQRVLNARHPDQAVSYNNLGKFFHATQNFAEAEDMFEQALTLNRAVLGESHPNVATNARNLAGAVLMQKRFDEAEPLLRECLRLTELAWGESHPKTIEDLRNLARLLRHLGKEDEAKLHEHRVLALQEVSEDAE